nr:HAMP domain-containing sensor histidine kinase [uncultured Blautia sp.]
MHEIQHFFHSLFNSNLDFRVRLFNILALGGTIISLIMALLSLGTGSWGNVLINFALAVISGGLFLYSYYSGRYQRCYLITIVLIFLIVFPIMFFTSGGYHGGMPAFFVFAIVFTVLMLEKWRALIVSLFEIILYIGLCLAAYYFPDSITPFATEADRLADVLLAFVSVSVVCGIVLYFHLKEYNQQQILLEKQNQRLRSLDNAKSTFLTTVAHEIKNPLNSISLHARDTSELLEEEPLDFSLMQENLRTIEQSVMRIDRIVLDLMDTVSIEQGRLTLSLVPTDLASLLRSLEKDYNAHPCSRKNQLTLHLSDSLPEISADPERLIQVISNLVSNAERHTHGGTITISLSGTPGWQTICVSDTGTGMSEKMRQNALKGYVSADKDYWRHGIGLYVCHQIVTAHGGKIWIESKKGEGTRVFFSLPEVI